MPFLLLSKFNYNSCINKIDIPNIDIEDAERQLIDLLGCNKNDIIHCSAKDGLGTEKF